MGSYFGQCMYVFISCVKNGLLSLNQRSHSSLDVWKMFEISVSVFQTWKLFGYLTLAVFGFEKILNFLEAYLQLATRKKEQTDLETARSSSAPRSMKITTCDRIQVTYVHGHVLCHVCTEILRSTRLVACSLIFVRACTYALHTARAFSYTRTLVTYHTHTTLNHVHYPILGYW